MLQIEAFVLYHRTIAQPRVLPLKPGLNVLTGWRSTGKSSLIEIVDYCFGRKTLTVSAGKIRQTVAWYGLVIRNDDKFAFGAGRPPPRDMPRAVRRSSCRSAQRPRPIAPRFGATATSRNCEVS